MTMSVTLPTGRVYILVIDTDAYSGNFERELAGWCTGAFDGRGHGKSEAADFAAEEGERGRGITNKLMLVAHHEYGDVYCTIRGTPGRLNNGMGFHYDAVGGDVQAARDKAKTDMAAYHAPHIKKCEDRIANNDFEAEGPGAWTKEACERTIASSLASIERAGNFVGWPAYESVAIFFSEPLTEEEVEIVKRRAYQYAAKPKACTRTILGSDPFNIRDVYVVEATTPKTEEVRL